MASTLWKPTADAKTGHTGSVFIAGQNLGQTIKIYDADSKRIIATGTFDKIYGNEGKYKGGYIYRFKLTGNNISNSTKSAVIVGEGGQYYWIGDASKRGDDLTSPGNLPRTQEGAHSNNIWNLDAVNRTETGTWSIPDDTQSNVSGIPGMGNVAKPELIDPALNKLTSITDTQIEFTDPLETLREIAKENRGQLDENVIKSMEYAGKLSEADTKQLISYLDTMTPYQRQLIEIENAFNQEEKLKAAEKAIPGVSDMLRGELKNAQTLASGRLLKDSEDRALEQVARSAGADAAWTRGLGDDSLIGKNLSDQLSVSQRQQVMAQGQSYLSQALQNAVGTLMDNPQKATMGSQIPAQPSKTVSELALTQEQILNNYTTMNPESALNAYINQRQAQATMDYNTKMANANFQEANIQRGIDIAASNAQAMNNYNQNVLNDVAGTRAAQNQSEQMNYLNFALEEFHLSDEEYAKLKEQIEAGQSIDWGMLGRKHKGSKYDFYDSYNKARGVEEYKEPENGETGGGGAGTSQDEESTNNEEDSDSGNSQQDEEPTTQRSTSYQEGDSDSINALRAAVLHLSDLYKQGYDVTKLIQDDGTITIPDANATYKDSGYFSILEFLSMLTNVDLEGII